MGNVLKKSTLKKTYLQYFTVIFSMRNVYYCANANARSKNYNLRTAQKTIILFSSLLQHVRNSLNGEIKVITPAQSYYVDGFHAASNTIYEYHGCIFHGCRKCYPKQGNMKRFCHPD